MAASDQPSLSAGPAVFVWIVWAGAFCAALGLVASYGNNVPYMDDWEIVPALTGAQPITGQWLWAQHNEHRLPFPRVLLLGLYRLSGNDFRAGMVFNVLALAGLAAAMIRAAGRLRGAASLSDAVFPLALLHWGHVENLLWSWQVGFIASAVLAGTWLILIVGQGPATFGRLTLTGFCAVGMVLCGANGLAFFPAMALWLASALRSGWGSAHLQGKPGSLVILALAGCGLLLAGLYFVGFEQDPSLPARPDLEAVCRTSSQFLCMSFGFSPSTVGFRGAGLAGLILVCLFILFRAWFRQSQERFRIGGLVLFFGAMLCLAFAVGWGRAGLGPRAGLKGRYVSLAVLVLCWVYFVFMLYARNQWENWLRRMLFVWVAVLFYLNLEEGRIRADNQFQLTQAFIEDLRAGMPPFVLAERFSQPPSLLYPDAKSLASYLNMLRQSEVGEFGRLAADPAVRDISLAKDNSTMHPNHIFALKKELFVYAVRIKFSFENITTAETALKTSWTNRSHPTFAAAERANTVPLLADRRPRTAVIWIHDRVDQFRLQLLNRPGVLMLWEVVLVIPASDEDLSWSANGVEPFRESTLAWTR